MNLEIPEIKQIVDSLNELKETLSAKKEPDVTSEWYNDEQCWKLKGGMALNTYRSNRYYQCKGGIPDAYVGGRKVWNRKSVMEWLPLTDVQLDEYHNKYKTGAKKR